MIELRNDTLIVRFPEVHRKAEMTIEFQRTLRIPDDDREYPLPPGLGRFPLRHVDDFSNRVSHLWTERGGVMLPMYQSEALWLNFQSPHGYPFAVKVGTGKINAVTGDAWSDALVRDPQDYLSIPEQPWLDGFCVAKGVIRQFVAMPLGSDYTAEEQLTGSAEHGGIQLLIHPLHARAWRPPMTRMVFDQSAAFQLAEAAPDMGMAPGGMMRQEIYDDDHDFADWDLQHRSRCFVHLANALVWRSITGQDPPTVPPTSAEYTRAGLPWFEYYAADRTALEGAERLGNLSSVAATAKKKGDVALPENESVDPANIVNLRAGLSPAEVREGRF